MENDLVVQSYQDVTVVNFEKAGVLDSSNIEAMGRSLMDLVQKQDHRDLVLDFSAVRFMSSQALGVLLQLKKAIDVVHGHLILVAMRPDLHKVFKITNLHKMFVFKDETDKALAELGVYIPKN